MARILLVDDEEFARETVRKILVKHGHHVMEATDGVQAMIEIHRNPCDLVITDLVMPEKDGIELIIELRKTFPSLPVIAISGGGRNRNLDFLDAARELGAAGALAKPFVRDALIEKVTRLLAAAVPAVDGKTADVPAQVA